jgi:N-acetylglutamate synthase-like GNAT family acetyltransferase
MKMEEEMGMQAVIRKAGRQDLGKLTEFLTGMNLGTDGLTEEAMDYFLLLEDEGGTVKGSLGLEAIGVNGLLRSLVVSSRDAEKEIFLLFAQMLQLAREKGIGNLFLATNKTTAVAFFEMLGFARVKQEDIPTELQGSEHVQQILTVDNSFFLKFTI